MTATNAQALVGREIPPLVATDLDGTLLDYRTRSVPAGFGAVLDRVLAAGTAFAVASGRTPGSIRSLFPEHAERIWIASDNGARLSRGSETIFERALEPGLWRALSDEACRIETVDVLLIGAEACYMRDSGAEAAGLFHRYYFPLRTATMLAACGRSYAMSGGHPAALAAARFVAPPCDENGEVTVLDRLFPPAGAAD